MSERIPEPGSAAAPDSPSDPQDDVKVDEERDVVTRHEESSVGPGAGESAVVRVTAPVEHEGEDEATRHPTLRERTGGDARPR